MKKYQEKIPKELITERLCLRLVSPKYSKEVFENFTDEVTVFMFPSTPKKEQETIDYLTEAEEKNKEGINYEVLIFNKKTDEFLGGSGVHHIDTKTPELGAWIKKSSHGHKYGREAVTALKEWADKNLDYEYLKYPVEVKNTASRKIPESLNGILFREYDDKRQDGTPQHLIEYRIYKKGK